NIRVIPKYHNEDGNHARANIKQALVSYKDRDGDGDTLFQQSQVHNRKLILDQHLCRNHESSRKGSYTQDQALSLIISQGVEESPKTSLFHDDHLHEFLHEDSTSQGSSSNVRPSHTPFEIIGRWSKDHPIAKVIGDPSRSVSTRKQLKTNVMWCYFDAFLTFIETENFK
nr:hypothetical protein [Tanacetum cinerariifolium]